MMEKVSSDMYPVSELHSIFRRRVISTGFFNTSPNIIVSFKLFTNIVTTFDVSTSYSEIIKKAIESISFNTVDGIHRLSEVDYMFVDNNNHCVAVLKDGQDFLMLYPESNTVIVKGSPRDFTLSTAQMKGYYWDHISAFPYLDKMAELIDSRIEKRAMLTNDVRKVAGYCISNPWIKNNILNCLNDLKHLVNNSYLLIT